jgi:hypothetical protein
MELLSNKMTNDAAISFNIANMSSYLSAEPPGTRCEITNLDDTISSTT